MLAAEKEDNRSRHADERNVKVRSRAYFRESAFGEDNEQAGLAASCLDTQDASVRARTTRGLRYFEALRTTVADNDELSAKSWFGGHG